jgi:ABC-type polysaccharide/polyol phosphate export permease
MRIAAQADAGAALRPDGAAARPEMEIRRYGEGVPRLAAAVADLLGGLARWPLVWALAWSDIRQRYRRAVIGPFWITISMAVLIVSLGTIYSALFGMDVRAFMPFIAAGFTVWFLINSTITESSAAFTSAEGMLRQGGQPISIHVYRVIVRNTVVFAHNAVVMAGVYVWQPGMLGTTLLLAIPGLLLLALNLLWISFLVAGFCTRFRDLPPIITNLLQIALFASPILFKPSQIPERFRFLVELNPVFYLLEVVRGPLIGEVPSMQVYAVLALMTLVGTAAAFLFYVRFRGRLVFWL